MERRVILGSALVAIAAVSYGVVTVLGSASIGASSRDGTPPATALLMRFILSTVLLGVVLIVTRRPLKAATGEGRWLAVLGAVVYAGETTCFFIALQHGTVAAVTLLFYIYPVLVVAVALVLRRARPSFRLLAALVSALTGAAIVIAALGGVSIDATGIGFIAGSATLFTSYVVGLELTVHRTQPLTGAFWLCGFGSVGLTLIALARGQFALPASPAVWLFALGMGVGSAVAFVTFFAGLRMVGSVRTGIISAFEPFSAAVLGAIFLAQPLGLVTVFGGAFIVGGAVLAVLARTEASVEAPSP